MKASGLFQGETRVIDAVGLGACLMLTGAIYLVMVQPAVKKQAEAHQQRTALDASRQEVDRLVQDLTKMRSEYRRTERRMAENSVRLEPAHRLNQRLASIAELASDNGLEIESIEPSGALETEHYVSVPIRLSGRGTYGASTRFLHSMHSSLPDVASRAVTVSSNVTGQQISPTFEYALVWYAAPNQ